MEETQEQPPCFTTGSEAKEMASAESVNADLQLKSHWLQKYLWLLLVTIFTILILGGQTVGNLLGRLYFDNGGNSKWMATLVQNAGFPLLVPFLFSSLSKSKTAKTNSINPSVSVLASIYVFLGLLLAADCMLYSLGLKYLPVSTYSLICASQLGFNVFFSIFLNAEKLTPFTINSVVLLTLSSVVLVIHDDSEDTNKTLKSKRAIGFICTVVASAGFALMMSVTQLVFQKIIRRQTFRVIIDMSIYQSLVATVAILVGLFESGEWKSLNAEMKEFKGGNASYVNNLLWTAVSWQIFSIGCIGLILKVSSLFSNAIGVVGLPITPVLAVIFFHDKMTGSKIISLLLAIWGFLSYAYQNYLDDLKAKAECKSSNSEISNIEM